MLVDLTEQQVKSLIKFSSQAYVRTILDLKTSALDKRLLDIKEAIDKLKSLLLYQKNPELDTGD